MIIRTEAGLDALAPETVVLDKDGDAWQKDDDSSEWWTVGSSSPKPTWRMMRHAPFRTMRVVDES